MNNKNFIKTNILQKLLIAIGSSAVVITNPERSDMIAMLGETTGTFTLQKIYKKMLNHPIGKEIIKEKPIINENTIHFNYLKTLPSNTFGKSYVNFMIKHGFSPNNRYPVQFIDDIELAYVMKRYREIHDFLHTLSGFTEVTVLSEIAVKWLEFIQTGLPMTGLSSIFGPIMLTCQEHKILLTEYIPWAIKCGRNCHDLMSIYYEKHFEKDINIFRKEINFTPFKKNNFQDSQQDNEWIEYISKKKN